MAPARCVLPGPAAADGEPGGGGPQAGGVPARQRPGAERGGAGLVWRCRLKRAEPRAAGVCALPGAECAVSHPELPSWARTRPGQRLKSVLKACLVLGLNTKLSTGCWKCFRVDVPERNALPSPLGTRTSFLGL